MAPLDSTMASAGPITSPSGHAVIPHGICALKPTVSEVVVEYESLVIYPHLSLRYERWGFRAQLLTYIAAVV